MNLKKVKAEKNIDLSRLTTLGIGGKAKYFFLAEGVSELAKLLKETGGRFYLLGNGSNLLVKGGQIEKPIIKLAGGFALIKEKSGILEVGSSTLLSFLLKYCIKNHLTGLENLSAIPATIGGMLSSAAASFGSSIFDYLEEVEIMDREAEVYKVKKDEIDYGYRHSGLQGKIILKGYFNFPKNNGRIKRKVKEIIRKRIKLQDFSFPSCGSIFKNPSFAAAGALIEKSGLKGRRKGNVKISDKHANFILNLGMGSYRDADYLIQLARDTVYKNEKIFLEEEIQRWI